MKLHKDEIMNLTKTTILNNILQDFKIKWGDRCFSMPRWILCPCNLFCFFFFNVANKFGGSFLNTSNTEHPQYQNSVSSAEINIQRRDTLESDGLFKILINDTPVKSSKKKLKRVVKNCTASQLSYQKINYKQKQQDPPNTTFKYNHPQIRKTLHYSVTF